MSGLLQSSRFFNKRWENKAGNSSNDLIIETVIDTDTKTAGESLQGEKNSDFKASQKTVEKETSSMNTGATTVNSAAELRRYKALLDEGLITQDDYDALKKKALGL